MFIQTKNIVIGVMHPTLRSAIPQVETENFSTIRH